MKICTKCKIEKSVECFDRNRKQPDGRRSDCKKCRKEYYHKTYNPEKKREYHKKTKEQRQEYKLKVKYNLSTKDYLRMYKNVKGNCEICHTHYDRLSVDHDHKKGHVRGLLCTRCNTGIGKLLDSPEILLSAAKYLKERK